MIKWKILEIWEQPIRCYAKRGPRGKVTCEKPALHKWDHYLGKEFHSGRGIRGQWYFWE